MEGIKWNSFVESLADVFKTPSKDYTVKHFKVEERLTHAHHKDIIQITMTIEIEKTAT